MASGRETGWRHRLAALAVHAYTAAGAVIGLLALLAALAEQARTAFLWLAMAVVIDSSDGALARWARVKQTAPWLDGARMDDIVDYLTYVFVPVVLLYVWGLLPEPGGLAVAACPLVASLYGFARTDAKTADHFFTGFPSYWNIVVLYLAALAWSPAANAAALLAFVALVFVRIGYIYPSRTPQFRTLTVTLGIAWGISVVAMIWLLPSPPAWLVYGSLAYPVYYGLLSLYLHSRRR